MTTHISTLHHAGAIGVTQRVAVPFGATVEEIALRFHASLDGLTAWVRAPEGHAEEWLQIPRDLWRRIRPKIDGAVMFGYRLHNNNILRSVFTLAATVLAAIVAPYFGPVIGALVTTAISVGAALAANALFPVAAASVPTSNALGDNQSRAFANVDSDSNLLAKDASLPLVLGQRSVSLPELAQPRPFLTDGTQSLDRLFGLYDAHRVTNIQVDGTPVDDYDSITTQVIEGFETDPTETFITKCSRVESVSETLTGFSLDGVQLVDQDMPAQSEPRWVRFSTASDEMLEELTIRLRFDGMVKTDSASDRVTVPLRVRFRFKGSTDEWSHLPEILVTGRTTETVLQEVRLRWDGEFGAPSAVGDLAYDFVESVPAATSGTLFEGSGTQWTAAPGLTWSAGRDGVRVTLDEAIHPKQEYEIEVKRGAAINASDFSSSSYQINGTVHSFFHAYASGGWRVHQGQGNYTARISVDYAIALIDRSPCQEPGTCLVALRSVGQSVRNVTGLAARYVHDWDGDGWNNVTTTDNPASHYRQLLHDFLTYHGIDTSLIDDLAFVAWREECELRGYKVSAAFAGEPIGAVLDQIATAGFARKRISDGFGIDWFRDRSAERPVQTFSPRNATISVEWFHDPQPAGIRARFNNADRDYRDDERQIANTIYTSERGYQVSEYPSIADPHCIDMRGTFDLLQKQYQSRRVWMIESAIEAMVCDRGDLIGVVSDLVDDSNTGARITAVQSSTTFDIDQALPVKATESLFDSDSLFAEANLFDVGAQSVALISTPTGTQEVTIKAVQGRTLRVEPAVVIDDPQELVGAHLTIGPRSRFMHRVIVGDVVRGEDERATLVCVDEAPEIFQEMKARFWQ